MSKKTQELILSLQAEVSSQRTVIRDQAEALNITNNRLVASLHNVEQMAHESKRQMIEFEARQADIDERLTRAEKQMGLVV